MEKCHFGHKEIKYLGFRLPQEGVKVDESKTDVIKDLPPTKNLKEVARFWGMIAWYQQFTPSYADLAEPSYQLKRKRLKFVRMSAAQEAYEKLKNTLTEA